MAAVCPDGDVLLALGEIHSGVLQNSHPLTPENADEMLSLIVDHPVRSWERPIRHAVSGRILTGVDCDLPSTGSARRAIGTVSSEISVTGGRLLQTSAQTEVRPAAENRRLSWSHYLARPGALETIGDLTAAEIVDGFLAPNPTAATLDLSGICSGMLSRAQSAPGVDGRTPFRASRTRLRWAALVVDDHRPATVRFMVEPDGLRTLKIASPGGIPADLSWLCQNLAQHDWLLTTVNAVVDAADHDRRDALRHLGPAIDHLLHSWMPTARLPDHLLPYWREIDYRSTLSVHWESLVQRVRDQLSMAMIERTGPRSVEVVERTRRAPEPGAPM